MTHSHKLTGKQLISRASFCFGNLGHSAFYGVMSTYFIIFVTSGMFAGLSKTVANKLIGYYWVDCFCPDFGIIN